MSKETEHYPVLLIASVIGLLLTGVLCLIYGLMHA
jgi:hypothetical protein